MSKSKWDYRDVSVLLQAFRDFLLGRKHTLHQRFPWRISARSIPPPDIPRGPEYKYSSQYYHQRNPFESVKPPVVAPVAVGTKHGRMKPESVKLPGLPTPGEAWWWDGHCYFEPTDPPPCPPMQSSPPPCKATPCDPPPVPPCPLSPDKMPKH